MTFVTTFENKNILKEICSKKNNLGEKAPNTETML